MLKNKGELVRFMFVGGINTANYYFFYLILFQIAGLNYLFSHWIAFLISMVLSFYLNVYFTYRVKPTLRKFLQFPITQVVNISISSAFIYIFVEYLHLNGYIAPILSVVFTIPVTFILTGKILKRGQDSS
ncbi:GtrA family protein [Falsibacillus albus]|uniref:GtrA family protein n=1 Tax=Falsibacillus albus TaxID=2478915 RepID=A0A3L7JGR4_9BACI|nr:GtrA family protein [Falsibacillus albus]RLQ89977.1 GtrA family protein [Falsibacillus albus]